MSLQPDARILVVDDFATMRRILKSILKQLGYTVVEEADNGSAAMDKLHGEQFDFVITDWSMPQMNGLDLVRAIRADERLKGTPVLMVAGESLKENVIEAVHAGVSNYVVKPFTAEVIREKMTRIFG